MSQTLTVTDDTFDTDVLASDRPVLVEFWAPWCGPCRMMRPMLDELAVEQADTLRVALLDIADNPATQERYEVQSTPTMILFKDGEPVHRFTGAKPMGALLKELEPHR